ncbi:MAG: tetratricopeptide repeat protein [Proteobacteria bacterium]|nr:tetratricopeptide repeat protein [Pseudomonadota bacterium]
MKKKTDKDNSLAWLTQGTEFQGIGDLEGAIKAYTKAIRFDSTQAGLYVLRAYVYVKTSRNRQAMRDVNKAIRLNPKMPEPYFIRATLKAENEKYKDAISDLNEALKLDPGYAEVYAFRAKIYAILGEGMRALMDYQHAALLGDGNTQKFLRDSGIGWLAGGHGQGSSIDN